MGFVRRAALKLKPQQKLNRQNNLSNNRGVDDITLCVLTVAAPRGGNTRELQKRGNTGFGSTGGGDAGSATLDLKTQEGIASDSGIQDLEARD
ncbi:hypothetical protein H4Q26_017041 [Puccinia striiformis f. sp. tritici PST-130]|nr:hypothetical protein H4Q26_017041 [Puccinia striiformis f. sp. tritici PST-130]